MTTPTRRLRLSSLVLTASLVVASPLLLSGCSLLPGSGGAGITIPGVGSFGAGKLPADFPKSVPVASGKVIFAAGAGNAKSSDGRIWNATISVSGADAYGQIKSQLEGAGFKVDAEPDSGDATGGTGTFVKDPDSVLVVVTKADDKTGWVANYTVTEGGPSSAPVG